MLFNVSAALLVPLMVLLNLFKGLFVRQGEPVKAIIEKKGMEEVIPLVVKNNYQPDGRYWNESSSMSLRDIGFFLRLVARSPHHPYFVLKAMMNVVRYSDMIRRHSPSVMIEFGEFSFSSSILTAYCHRYAVKHIDIMHGEKLWFIRDAYFHYDECYVWDEYYANLFRSLKAEPTQFRVALPPSLQIDTNAYLNADAYADYKYYLASFNEEEIKKVVDSMCFAKCKGKSVKFRPHPRYSDIGLLQKYVASSDIENPREDGGYDFYYAPMTDYREFLVQRILFVLYDMRNDIIDESVKMRLIAEESGKIRCDAVQKVLEFVLVAGNQCIILVNIRYLLFPQSFLQAAVQNGTVRFRKRDSTGLVDEIAKFIKL